MTTPDLPSLCAEHRNLFDEVRTTAFMKTSESYVFLVLSPMTHDPLWSAASMLNASNLRVALFYDLIQLQYPQRYLNECEVRGNFDINLAFLKYFDHLISISAASGNEAVNFAGIKSDKISVSGVAVRPSLEPVKGESPVPRGDRSYYLLAGGGDPRKNPECVVTAHARRAKRKQTNTSLRIIGSYPSNMRKDLRSLYAREGGSSSSLTFFDHLDDEVLRQEYRHAIAVIVPSHAEGFSVPIVEASAAGTPALASDIPAHRELIGDADARFSSSDPQRLEDIFARLEAPQDNLWDDIARKQADTWKRFRVEEIADRVVSVLLAGSARPLAPAIKRGARLALGVLTPLPPAASGVADFSFGMVEALSALADVRVYTETQGAARPAGAAALLPLIEAESDLARLDQVVTVIGNSHFHRSEFDFLLRHGGSSIVHDARMINFYVQLLGIDRAMAVARGEYAGELRSDIVVDWMLHQERLPILFLSEIVRASDSVFVHSPTTAKLIDAQYGKTPFVLPFAQYNHLDRRYASAESKRTVREHFEITPDSFLVATFGFVAPDKAPDELIWAIKLLRDWGVPAKLIFCGDFVTEELGTRLRHLVAHLDMDNHIRFAAEVVDVDTYRSLLFAADAAIQLRTYFMGGLSGALNDCIAAAMPCVANAHLATAMDAPPFVRRVPDSLSPLLLAEALLDIIASGDDRRRPTEAGQAFAKDHSFETYAERLVAHLGGETGGAAS